MSTDIEELKVEKRSGWRRVYCMVFSTLSGSLIGNGVIFGCIYLWKYIKSISTSNISKDLLCSYRNKTSDPCCVEIFNRFCPGSHSTISLECSSYLDFSSYENCLNSLSVT